jgi:hypothetical protein
MIMTGPLARWLGPGIAALAILASSQGRAQDALLTSKADQTAADARHYNVEGQAYTLKMDDFRMLAATSLELDWSDNINEAEHGAESDFIVRPMGQATAWYPVTQNSLLSLNLSAGYSKYLDHDAYSSWYVGSGSGLAFDIDVGQFTFGAHDRMQYIQDAVTVSALAGTGLFAYFQNVAGVYGTWDLNDVVPSLGYDHENYIVSPSGFDAATRSTEDFFARASFRVYPRVTVGVESAAGLTTYQERVLNNNTDLSAGVFGDWKPNSALHVTARAGYVVYIYDAIGSQPEIPDQDATYLDLTVSDQVTDKIFASLSMGHELVLGIQANATDIWYVHPSVSWKVLHDVTLRATPFYEDGSQTLSALAGNSEENYDWYGADLGFTYTPRRNLNVSVDYRLTSRSSDLALRSYTQDQIGLTLTYSFQ